MMLSLRTVMTAGVPISSSARHESLRPARRFFFHRGPARGAGPLLAAVPMKALIVQPGGVGPRA